MENWRNISNGFDMLNESKSLKITEVKTPSPPLSSADPPINEGEDYAVRSDTSSGGSSPSDLKKRLQHLPSPHDATRLVSHVANVNRRLSQKRDIYFHGTPNRIEENVEREETEQERDNLLVKNSLADLKSKDARARRRAKIRLEDAKNRDMVISKSIQSDSDHKPATKLFEPRIKEIVDGQNFEQRPRSAEMEMLNTERVTQQFVSLSARLPSINSPYRKRENESKSDSNRSQTNPMFLRLNSSGKSHESSPKDRIDLQPSPVPFAEVRPTRFGGYRPQAGIILQNLSSGSEPDSNREITSIKHEPNRAINPLSPITPEAGNVSWLNREIRNERSNDTLPSLSMSSRRSSNHALVNSSRNDIFQCIIDSSRMNVNQEKLCSTALSSGRENRTSEPYFFKTTNVNSTRSDIGRSTQDAFTKNFDEPWFLSAREDIRRHSEDLSATPPSLLQTPARSNVSPCSPKTTTDHSDTNFRADILSNASTRRSCEKSFLGDDKETSDMISATNPNCQPVASTPKELRSPENELPSPTVENNLNDKLDHSRANLANTWALKRAISKCIVNYNDGAEDVSVESQTTPSPQCKTCRSESQSGASTSRELFVEEFARMLEQNHRQSPKSTRNEEFGAIDKKEFSNVPALALTSQEVSQSSSPSSKHRSNRCLNADTLIMALSNASQSQKQVKKESLADSKTVSRPNTSDLDSSLDNRSKTISLKSAENQVPTTTTRYSCRSSLSTKSKIPIKIPTNRSKLSIVSRLTDVDKDRPIESSRQSFRRNSLSPADTTPKLSYARSNKMSKSCETSPSIKGYTSRNMVEPIELVSGSSRKTDTPREQSRYSSSRCSRRSERNSYETNRTLKDARSRLCSPLQSGRNTSDRPASRGQLESRITSRPSSKCTSSNVSPIKRCTIGDTFESSNLFHHWQEEKTKKKATMEISDSSESETDTSFSHSYDSDKPVKEQLKTITPRSRSVDTQFEDIQQKYYNSTYEGEVHDEKEEEKWKPNPMENQIGDGGCQEVALEKSSKRRFEGTSFDSSPEDEDYIKGKKIAENREKFRFSLEKLAADQLRRSLSTEQTRTNQLDTGIYYTDRLYDIPQYTVNCSSSTSRLRHDRSRESPRSKKKSQDRFPFTISEKTSVSSMKFKVPSLLGNLDEDGEDTGYKLDMHPSITRLAGSGSVDTAADIINYVTRTELENRSIKSTGMKGLVKKFSARWKKSKRRDGGTDGDTKAANVIYKNKEYREECESSVESCSESSLLKGFKMYDSLGERLCKDGGDSPDEKSSVVSDKKSIDRESSRNTPVDTANPCRRYDRDDLWVQAFKNLDSDPDERKEDVETSSKVNESVSSKDPYSVFFIKSARESPEVSARTFLPENNEQKQNVSLEKRRNRVKFRDSSLAIVQQFSDESVHEKPDKTKNSGRGRRNKNMQSGCLCLRFYRMIVPTSFGPLSKYRSRINDNSSSIKKKSRFSSEKKKG